MRHIKFGYILTSLVLSLAVVVDSGAGTLTQSNSPAATGYTLSDIYTRLTTNATATEEDHVFTPGSTPSASMYTLSQIYNAIPTITANTVLSGNTYLGVAGTYNANNLTAANVRSGVSFGSGLTGAYPSAVNTLPSADAGVTDLAGDGSNITSSNGNVEWWQSDGTRQTAALDFPDLANLCSTDTSNGSSGTLTITANTVLSGTTICGTAGTASAGVSLANMFNGTDGSFEGGSQATGGVEQNLATSGNYSATWTDCTGGNNYCGTGLSSADAMDGNTGLVWSQPCSGAGCSSFSTGSPTSNYTWDNTGASNNSLTASELCTGGDHGESGWFLPNQLQLLQVYIDNAADYLHTTNDYWSATNYAANVDQVWSINIGDGRSGNLPRNPSIESWGGAAAVICVR